MKNYREQQHRANIARFGEPKNLDELFNFVVKVAQFHEPLLVGFAWDIYYRKEISNTHACPINGVTNFSRESNRPTGYSGWTGRVWLRYSDRPRTWGSDAMNRTQTHTGSGGYGDYGGPWAHECRIWYDIKKMGLDLDYPEPVLYGFDYKIFEDDWPLVKRWREQQEIVSLLTDQIFGLSNEQCWCDLETRYQDRAFEEQALKLVEEHDRKIRS